VRSEISREVWKSPTAKAATPATFGAYAEDWLLVRDLRPRTRAHYRQLLDTRILPALGETPIKDISPSLVRSWYASIDDGKATYRAHSYGLLRTILTTAVGDEIIAANPCHIRGAGAAKRRITIKPASLPELEKLTLAMPEQYRAAVLIAAWCGLRFGELTELRRKDVDLKGAVIRVRRAVAWVDSLPVVGKPKSDAGVRDVAIPPHLVPIIKAHIKDHAQWGTNGLLFPSPKGVQLTTSTLYASFWPARKVAGRPDLRWHDLRHTGAVLAAATGATLAELMARLGHSTPGAALRYQHAAEGRDAVIAKKLSELAQAGDG
jgi:integrase